MTTFVIADLHFGDASTHARRRDQFASVTAMDRAIVVRWNEVVTDHDVVHVLGDVGKRQGLELIRHLRGTKHLVAGNADDLEAVFRTGLFTSVGVARWLPGLLLTHIPVHPDQLRGKTINVHGHLHSAMINDPRYVCVSAEQTGYVPVPLKEVAGRSSQLALF